MPNKEFYGALALLLVGINIFINSDFHDLV